MKQYCCFYKCTKFENILLWLVELRTIVTIVQKVNCGTLILTFANIESGTPVVIATNIGAKNFLFKTVRKCNLTFRKNIETYECYHMHYMLKEKHLFFCCLATPMTRLSLHFDTITITSRVICHKNFLLRLGWMEKKKANDMWRVCNTTTTIVFTND